jgi:hypothetical protein
MKRYIVNPQTIPTLFNQNVITPLGTGVAFGIFHLKDAGQESVGQRVVVRLKVDDEIRPHLAKANCLTPRATATAVFTFGLDEVEV